MKALSILCGFITAVFVALTSPAMAGSDNGWAFITEDEASYIVKSSIDAQDGEHLIMIDGTTLNYPIDYFKETTNRRHGFRPSGYLYQTIDANPYTNKHLHISGFARSLKPDFVELEKQFSDYYEGQQEAFLSKFLDSIKDVNKSAETAYFKKEYEDGYLRESQYFKEFVRRSYKDLEYGIVVILDLGEWYLDRRQIQVHKPTSVGAPRLNELWNRFNVEVSIPKGCKSISIVLWQQGIAISQFDHVAISEQGSVIDTIDLITLHEFDTLIKKIKENNNIAANFSNLSFE